MNKWYFLLFTIFMVGFLSGEASAGSLGDAPPEDGEDWEITQYTFVWDEVISINDLILAETSGGLKLKNVILYAEGDIEFGDNVEMIDTKESKELLDA